MGFPKRKSGRMMSLMWSDSLSCCARFALCVELGAFHYPVEIGPSFDFVVFGEHVSARDGAEVVAVGVDPSDVRPHTANFSGGDDLADEGAELGVGYGVDSASATPAPGK